MGEASPVLPCFADRDVEIRSILLALFSVNLHLLHKSPVEQFRTGITATMVVSASPELSLAVPAKLRGLEVRGHCIRSFPRRESFSSGVIQTNEEVASERSPFDASAPVSSLSCTRRSGGLHIPNLVCAVLGASALNDALDVGDEADGINFVDWGESKDSDRTWFR